MSKNINTQIKAQLDGKSKTIIREKLKTYNLDIEMNYAVAVIKLLITNSETKNSNELVVNIVPKVHYVTPFVTKKLAEEYISELSKVDKMTMFLHVDKGDIIVKNDEIEEFVDSVEESASARGYNNTECGEMSYISFLNILAYNWLNNYLEEEKEECAFKLGGIKNYQDIRSIFDNWEFQ